MKHFPGGGSHIPVLDLNMQTKVSGLQYIHELTDSNSYPESNSILQREIHIWLIACKVFTILKFLAWKGHH